MSMLSHAVGGGASRAIGAIGTGGFSSIGSAFGGGHHGVGDQWNDYNYINDPNIDPVVQYIAQHRGAPHGTAPEQWWNKSGIDAYAREYLNSLSPSELVQRYQNYDPNKSAQDFKRLYGRKWDLTPDKEYYGLYKGISDTTGGKVDPNIMAQLLPAYQEGGTAGNAALAAWATQYKQSPEYLKTQAPKYSNDVNQIFSELLKRGATKGELDHFGQMLATGQTDLFELGQYVQSLPEYQTAADTQFRSGLANELQGYDTKFFNKTSPEILNQYAKAGIQNSSALDYAMTDLLGNIASQRGQYLSGLSAQQYGGNKEAARQDYQAAMNQYLNTLGQNQQRAYGLQDYYNKRGDQTTDYRLQAQDYANYLNSMQQKKNRGLGSAIGGLVGFGAGALTGNPLWAMAGTQAGGGFGSFFN